MKLSVCGIICEECNFYLNNCKGCFKLKGKPFWTEETINRICPIYDCSINEKAIKNCGYCKNLPCVIFIELKDPNITLKKHKEGIKKQVNRLKDINRIKKPQRFE